MLSISLFIVNLVEQMRIHLGVQNFDRFDKFRDYGQNALRGFAVDGLHKLRLTAGVKYCFGRSFGKGHLRLNRFAEKVVVDDIKISEFSLSMAAYCSRTTFDRSVVFAISEIEASI